MVNRFILNEVSCFGPGARKELPGVVARLGFKKALVVTDKGLMQFGVAKACGVYEIGMSTDEAACKAIEELSAKVGTNKRLTDLGIKESDISALAEQAINDVCTPGNPRPVTKQDIIDLYHQIL